MDVSGLDPYDYHDPETMKAIWEPRKEYIEKDLWVIRNFLSQEEIDELMVIANDPEGWYTTRRSPYGGNTKNKFVGYVPEYDDNGVMILPGPNSVIENNMLKDGPVKPRLYAVVAEEFAGAGAFQSFFEVPEEQIIAELGHTVDYAMDFHYEREDDEGVTGKPESSTAEANMTATISLYVNDDYDGGVLEFKNKDYVVKPEAGMLVNVPLPKEFEHRVTKVTNGNRHTLYGRSWDNSAKRHFSTNECC